MSTIEEHQARYGTALHAMQAGVAIDQGRGSEDGSPKHLRVGVNAAMVSIDALTSLLVEKGLIDEEELWRHLAAAAERERDRYEQLLTEKHGVRVSLVGLS